MKLYHSSINNYGKPRADLTKETFFWLWLSEARMQEKIPIVHESDIASHSLQLFQSHFLNMQHSIQKDSNLVDSASSIRLSQRLSHACLSINKSILWNCEWLIISVIVYLMVLATWITVVILELIHASNPDFWEGCIY